MNLCFGVLLAPYRVDYYNYLHDQLNFEIYFQLKGFKGQLYSNEEVMKKCTYKPNYLRIHQIGEDRRIAFGLRQIIKQHNPKIVLVPEFSLLTIQIILIKWLFGYKFKIMSQCDDSYSMVTNGGFSLFHDLSRRICMPFLDDLLIVDKRTVNWYQQKYRKGRWLPMLQKEDVFFPADSEVIQKLVQQKIFDYSLQNVKRILFVGRIIPEKNMSSLFHACKDLPFAYKLIIVGDGILREELQMLADQLALPCEFIGAQSGDDLVSWYSLADVFVLPSMMEAFGAVTNEALLCGCNCCISSRAGSACLIEEGVNGYLIDPTSPDDITAKIVQCTSLPATSHRRSKMLIDFSTSIQSAFNL